MEKQPDLFASAPEQPFAAGDEHTKDSVHDRGRRIQGEIAFERTETGVRVTARDAEHRLLWGCIASKETLRQIHSSVAMYSSLQNLIGEELQKVNRCAVEGVDAITAAAEAVRSLEGTLTWLQSSLDVREVKDATMERARALARIIADADRQIMLEASRLKGMKPRGGVPPSI